jgi:integrase
VKRANGSGSIRQNERGKYEVRVVVLSDKGKKVRRKVTGRTQAEAWARAEALRARPVGDDPTVELWLTTWISDRVPGSDLSRRTVESYTYMVRAHIVPALGGLKLSQLRPTDVEQMMGNMKDQGLSPWTIRQARAVLRRALTIAERDELVSRNVAKLVDGPRIGDRKRQTLTPEQFRSLVEAVDTNTVGVLTVFLASTGLRIGEALGLEWQHVDLSAGTLTVLQAAKKDVKGRVYIDRPKTPGSKRTIHLSKFLVTRLREAAPSGGRFVFARDPEGFEPLRLDTAGRSVKRHTTKVLGEAFTPHGLRHSAASLMLAEGVPLKTVSETLGHASISTTADIYGHLLAPARAEAASAFDNMISNA